MPSDLELRVRKLEEQVLALQAAIRKLTKPAGPVHEAR